MLSIKSLLLGGTTPVGIPMLLKPVVISLISFTLGLTAGLYINSWRLGEKMAQEELTEVRSQLEGLRAATEDLRAASDSVNRAGIAFVGTQQDLLAINLRLTGALKTYAKDKPLPPECVPDDTRMQFLRNLSDSNKAKFSPATGQQPK